ncbi:MAG: hypothetical protein AVDCRST_MAG19-4437 [uncultured Thermomicrobiales bacterium]|uniref:Uncharacterized protein n=1 Tax=uncultured Thermomicrobiales bacterium TaxID=1645740 RepID=A0A6J4VSV7_9BACT|nr:MAG: hypothetical protein AVDCRST_MAG19-4437 [uncultured Thermomicrobiales bacterium]
MAAADPVDGVGDLGRQRRAEKRGRCDGEPSSTRRVAAAGAERTATTSPGSLTREPWGVVVVRQAVTGPDGVEAGLPGPVRHGGGLELAEGPAAQAALLPGGTIPRVGVGPTPAPSLARVRSSAESRTPARGRRRGQGGLRSNRIPRGFDT